MNEDYFDYQELTEQPENLDFDHMVQCPHCKNPIPSDALICYYCGNKVSQSKYPKWLIWVSIFVVIIFFVIFIL